MMQPQSRCRKPQDPKTCSAEQVRACHGETKAHDCEGTGCQRDPEGCSAEQIRECHGEVPEHPCLES